MTEHGFHTDVQTCWSPRRPLRPALFSIAALVLTGTAVLSAQTGTTSAAQVPANPIGGVSADAALASRASTAAAGNLIAVPEDFSKLKIAPGFLLDLQVFDEPDLSAHIRVGQDGNVVLPLAGPVHVAGDTNAEAQKKIEDKLRSSEIMKNPQVTLNIIQYAPIIVTVLGEVNSGGRLQLLAPHSLLDVISFAGGETVYAGAEVMLRHEQDGHTTTTTYRYGRDSSGDDISKVEVHGGDTVIVPRAGIVYVLGAVNRPGGYLMQEDGKLDAAQALSLAMGTALQAKTGDIRIIRRRPDGTFVEIPLNYKDMSNGKLAPPQLQAQDIVYVPMSKVKATFTSGASLLGEAAYSTVYATR